MNAITKSFRQCAETLLELHANQVVTIKRVQGACLQCVRGSVWVTLENDPHDFVLSPGERVCINVPGRMVVEGLEPSEVTIERAQSQSQRYAPTSKIIARLSACVARLFHALGFHASSFHDLDRSHRCPPPYSADPVMTYHGSFRL